MAGYSPAFINAMGSFHDANPVTGHRGTPNFRGRFKTPQFDVTIVHDAVGFRQQEFQKPATAGAHRVAVFGDSFVWGWGVEQGEVFSDQLSRRLADWRVENFGINGTGTAAQYELFAAECRDQLQGGDVVLLTFYGNDFADNVTGTRHAAIVDGQVTIQPMTGGLQAGWRRSLQESSYLFNYVSYVINRWQLERRIRRAEAVAIAAAAASKSNVAEHSPPEAPLTPKATAGEVSSEPQTIVQPASQNPPPSPAPAPVATPLDGDAAAQLTIARHYLESWQRDCAARQIRFIVAYIPGVGELDEGRDGSSVRYEAACRQSFETCTEGTGIEVLDLLTGLLAAKRSGKVERVIIAGDGHWNAAGHRGVAEIIAARLADSTTARR